MITATTEKSMGTTSSYLTSRKREQPEARCSVQKIASKKHKEMLSSVQSINQDMVEAVD